MTNTNTSNFSFKKEKIKQKKKKPEISIPFSKQEKKYQESEAFIASSEEENEIMYKRLESLLQRQSDFYKQQTWLGNFMLRLHEDLT